MDEALLEEALAARDRCRDVDLELGRARADFCEAVRRLHAAGTSLREMATALDLSHQRVHQLVEGSGSGVWARLRRGGKPAVPRSPRLCSFCGTSQLHTRKLVAGPGVFICEGCIGSALRAATGAAPTSEDLARFKEPTDARDVSCNFCGKNARRVDRIAQGGFPARFICSACLILCDEILKEDRRAGV